ncbi:hypothetical protein QUC31_001318 [Theobroma cacao]|nr:SANT/Myb domain - like 10 [Theobroma cacao]
MVRQVTQTRRCSICRLQGHYSTTCQLKTKDHSMPVSSKLLERKQGKFWTEQEHKAFLMGLEVYGQGKWKKISENLVKTRTPSQIASHAQKFNLWLKAVANDPEKKHNFSIFQVQQTPISQFSSSTANGGASETTSQIPIFQFSSSIASGGVSETTSQVAHPLANTIAMNPCLCLRMSPAGHDTPHSC